MERTTPRSESAILGPVHGLPVLTMVDGLVIRGSAVGVATRETCTVDAGDLRARLDAENAYLDD